MAEPFELEIGETEDAEIGRTLGAAAAAMSLPKPSRDKAMNAKTAAFLDEQTAVLRLQKEHLHEQRQLQLSHLNWRRFSDWMKAALQLMTAVIGLAIAGGLGAAVWDAMRADSVVVDTFRAPPALAAKGLDGVTVASGLLDELQRLQAETRVARTKRGVRDAWSNDIRVEVPDTGVSIGELVRDLHRWLGHETHVTGDLVQTDAGLRLTVRGDGFTARSFVGAPQDLPRLITDAAEYVYGQAEPYLAASYFEAHERDRDALSLIRTKYSQAPPKDRPLLLNAWGNALGDLGDMDGSLAKYQQAIQLQPDFWIGFNNVMNSEWGLGREEDVWRTGRAFEKAATRGRRRRDPPEVYYQNLDAVIWDLPAVKSEVVADLEAHEGVGSSFAQNGPSVADAAVRMHDPATAELYLQTAVDADRDPYVVAMTHYVHGWAALDRGDGAKAVAELEAFAAAYADPAIRAQAPGYGCWLAAAEIMAGRLDKADEAAKAGGHFVDCYRFRADILDKRGDWAGAHKAYSEAVAVAPDVPSAYYSWGLALARHGDLAGAEAKYAAANARGPHWADPLKAWGDVLQTQHRFPAAEAKYAEAAKYAPKWIALHLAWGDALRADRKFREAIAQYHAVTEAAGHG